MKLKNEVFPKKKLKDIYGGRVSIFCRNTIQEQILYHECNKIGNKVLTNGFNLRCIDGEYCFYLNRLGATRYIQRQIDNNFALPYDCYIDAIRHSDVISFDDLCYNDFDKVKIITLWNESV
jgi:hypothetical protein